MIGRSLCYRMAASAPLLASLISNDQSLKLGFVKRCFIDSWSVLIMNHAVHKGVPTQGLIFPDPSILDNYSGPASSLWGLRSLVLFNTLDTKKAFFESEIEPYEVEKSNFSLELGKVGIRLEGQNDQVVVRRTLLCEKNEYMNIGRLGLLARKVKNTLLFRINRSNLPRDNLTSSSCSKTKPFGLSD